MEETTTQLTMLDAARKALRITVTAYDDEIKELIASAIADLQVVGITWASDVTDPLIRRAVLTYVRTFFGTPDDFDKMKAAYDEQKAQLHISRHSHNGGTTA